MVLRNKDIKECYENSNNKKEFLVKLETMLKNKSIEYINQSDEYIFNTNENPYKIYSDFSVEYNFDCGFLLDNEVPYMSFVLYCNIDELSIREIIIKCIIDFFNKYDEIFTYD